MAALGNSQKSGRPNTPSFMTQTVIVLISNAGKWHVEKQSCFTAGDYCSTQASDAD